MSHVAQVVPRYTSNLVDGKRPVAVFVDGGLACLIMADEFLLMSEIQMAYAKWTGFDIASVQVGLFGLNILGMDRVELPEVD